MRPLHTPTMFALLTTTLLVSGCGGTGAASTMISGKVTGLTEGAHVVLADNNENEVTVTSDGNFFFSDQVQAGTPYSVTVSVNPIAESCLIKNGTGIVGENSGDVTNVDIICTPVQGDITGEVVGLAPNNTLTLQNLDTPFHSTVSTSVIIKANGAFVFPTVVPAGFSYDVVVSEQPTGQNCSVTNGSGTMPDEGNISAIQVICH